MESHDWDSHTFCDSLSSMVSCVTMTSREGFFRTWRSSGISDFSDTVFLGNSRETALSIVFIIGMGSAGAETNSAFPTTNNAKTGTAER